MGQMQQNFGQNQYLKVITDQAIREARILMPFGSFSIIFLFHDIRLINYIIYYTSIL